MVTTAERECELVRILLADDHTMFLDALRAYLETQGFEIVGVAVDGREAVRLARAKDPDVALLDIAMPLMNGIDTAREIRRYAPRTRTIAVTMHDEQNDVLAALEAGVRGYVLKTQAVEELVRAIHEVIGGGTYLSPAISQFVVNACLEQGPKAPNGTLTGRERQTLQLIAEGNSNHNVAAVLCVSCKTVASHRAHIMQKLCVHNTAGLVREAVRLGLIKP